MHEFWKLNNIDVNSKVFHRLGDPSLSYKDEMKIVANDISAWSKETGSKTDLILEHHINSFTGMARGCEGLVAEDDISSLYFADQLTDAFSERFLIRKRGRVGDTDGVKVCSPKVRGGIALEYYKELSKVSLIWEPCFGNKKTKSNAVVFGDDKGYFFYMATQVLELMNIKQLPGEFLMPDYQEYQDYQDYQDLVTT